jgi:hypothetical protein
MPTLPNMGLVTPTPAGDSGTWDDKINACFALVDAHDHTPAGNGVPITAAALDIDDDVSFSGHTLTSLGKISFSTIAAPSTGSKNLFVNTADNELYWRTNAGTNVKLTSGASINTTLVGGIVGDYTSVGASVAYIDADATYTFKDQNGKWARSASGPVRLYEFNTTESVYVELAAPAALAVSYTVTFPTGAPAATTTLKMDSSGNLSTAGLPITVPINAASYASHTGDGGNARGAHAFSQDGYWFLPTSSGSRSTARLVVGVPVVQGDVITAWSTAVFKSSSNANTLEVRLYKITGTTTPAAQVGATGTNAGNANGAGTCAGTTSLPVTVGAGESYYFEISQTAASPSAADRVHATTVTITRLNG